MPKFDLGGGERLNATEVLLLLPHFPAYAGKPHSSKEVLSPGGASALVACAELGMRAKAHGQ